MYLVVNRDIAPGPKLRTWTRRMTRSAMAIALAPLRFAWTLALLAFGQPTSDGPDRPPTIGKAAALREGALLSEDVDLRSDRFVA